MHHGIAARERKLHMRIEYRRLQPPAIAGPHGSKLAATGGSKSQLPFSRYHIEQVIIHCGSHGVARSRADANVVASDLLCCVGGWFMAWAIHSARKPRARA